MYCISVLIILIFSSVVFAITCPQIPAAEAQKQMEQRITEIRHHDRLYYQEHRQEISDVAYDKLKTELANLEQCFPSFAAVDSPTGQVSVDGPGGALTIKHEQPMLSLNSSVGPAAVEALLKRSGRYGRELVYVVQPKVDGLPVEVVYEEGKLISAALGEMGSIGRM